MMTTTRVPSERSPILREVRAEDLETFFPQQSDPEANRVAGTVPRAREEFLAHWAETAADPTVRRLSVEHAGRLAGHVASFNRGEAREVCYWLGREFWGQGLATRALGALLEREPVRPLEARVAKRNPASIRVAEKAGFVRVADERYQNRAGEWIDELVLRLAA